MKKVIVVLALFCATAVTFAAGNKLLVFDGPSEGWGYGGSAVANGDGSATLDTTDGNPAGSYAGVYIWPSLPPKPIGDVNKLSFTFDGGPVTGGSPRFSIPIDENGDGGWDNFAFIDAANCGVASGSTVTGVTVNLECPVFYYDTLYPNWAAFAAAHADYRIAKDAVTFIIADQPFQGKIYNVQIGKAAAKK